jgi:hypothetical protein
LNACLPTGIPPATLMRPGHRRSGREFLSFPFDDLAGDNPLGKITMTCNSCPCYSSSAAVSSPFTPIFVSHHLTTTRKLAVAKSTRASTSFGCCILNSFIIMIITHLCMGADYLGRSILKTRHQSCLAIHSALATAISSPHSGPTAPLPRLPST